MQTVFENLAKLKPVSEEAVNVFEKWIPVENIKLPSTITPTPPPQTPLTLIFQTVKPLGLENYVTQVYAATPKQFLKEALAWLSQTFSLQTETPEKQVSLSELLNPQVEFKTHATIYSKETLKTLLKPIPEETVRTPLTLNTKPPTLSGEIVLGEILNHLEEPTGRKYRLKLCQTHTLILGSTGSGKSTTAARLALETARNKVKTLIIDWTGEYREKLSKHGPKILKPGVNIAIPLKQLTQKHFFETLTYHIETTWNTQLTPMQYTTLKKAVYKTSNPREIFREIEKHLNSPRKDIKQSAQALLNRLEPVKNIVLENSNPNLPPLNPWKTPNLTIITLNHLETIQEKTITAQLTLHLTLKQTIKTITTKPITHIILEEAHHYIKPTTHIPTLIEQTYLEHRKHGTNITTITPHPNLPPTITTNTHLTITHRTNTLTTARTAAELITPTPTLTNTYTKQLKQLKTGQTIITSTQQPQPTLTQIQPP